jgi:hypothetical protein
MSLEVDVQVEISTEDARETIVEAALNGQDVRAHGYDIWLPTVVRQHLQSVLQAKYKVNARQAYEWTTRNDYRRYSRPFCDAAWDLCLRGILRPGVTHVGEHATPEGNGGSGYSLTAYGKTWIAEAGLLDAVPHEPGRIAEMLQGFVAQFGAAFGERSYEAVRCYYSRAYLATCAMCGAAAESIILCCAAEKRGDVDTVLDEYMSRGGRGRVLTFVTGQLPDHLRRPFSEFMHLLTYWRDSSSHGQAMGLSEVEAFTAVIMLVRLAQLVSSNWSIIVGQSEASGA